MLQPLPPYLDRDRILFLQVLVLSILVAKLGFLIFFFFLSDKPEVVDSKTLIVVLAGGDFLLLDGTLECTALHTEGLLVLLVVVVIDGISTGKGFLLGAHRLV